MGSVKTMKKRIFALLLCLLLLTGVAFASPILEIPQDLGLVLDPAIFQEDTPTIGGENLIVEVPYAILMEKETGTVIFEKEADSPTPLASVTKVMTTLLIVEEINAGRLAFGDMVSTSARAASQGGSQVYLEEGEQMSVEDMLKAIIVSSANDASLAMAEHIAGSEEAFVARMNERARELGMTNTNFINSTGLPGEGADNISTARDVALMSRELIGHDWVKEYTTIWMDNLRNGEFGLSNTNRLIYYYDGATGLKTGFTQGAMYCLAATAQRDGIEFIAVVLHGQTSDARFEAAKTLLSYGFANYTLIDIQPEEILRPLPVLLGVADVVQPVLQGSPRLLLHKTAATNVTMTVEMLETIDAPVAQGQILGNLNVVEADRVIAVIPIVAGDGVEKISLFGAFVQFLQILVHGNV